MLLGILGFPPFSPLRFGGLGPSPSGCLSMVHYMLAWMRLMVFIASLTTRGFSTYSSYSSYYVVVYVIVALICMVGRVNVIGVNLMFQLTSSYSSSLLLSSSSLSSGGDDS
jgi:hypothetical protein